MKDCLFCQIAKKKISADVVYEDKDLVAFWDIKPIAPVHLLIIPRKHLAGIQSVEEKDKILLGKMLLTARKVAEKKKLKGYKLFFNCGKLGGQVIFHLHLHLIGGWRTPEEFHQMAKKLVEGGGVL